MSKEKTTNNIDTTNPLVIGVTYDMFLKNVDSKTTVDSLLKKHGLSKDEVSWIKEELSNYKINKKK